jgi:hypothetical protein
MLRVTCSPEFLADIFTTRSLSYAHLNIAGLPEGSRLVSANPKVVYEGHWSTSIEWELLFCHPNSPDNVVEDVSFSLTVEGEDC